MLASGVKRSANKSKGTGFFLYIPIPSRGTGQYSIYLIFLTFFVSLAGFSLICFSGIHPQPQSFFFSAILITSFLIKGLCNHLIIRAKKFAYFFLDFSSFTLCRTVLSSLLSSFSYFFSDSKSDISDSTSRNFPVPWHPHVQTSFNICRQFSIAFSSIEYGIQYPFLSLLTSPACFNILRCWDTAAVVIPIVTPISLAPKGPWALSSSIIFTRVSTPSTLNISEGSKFIGQQCYN